MSFAVPGYSLRRFTLLALCALASCAAPDIGNWPDSVPPRQLFVRNYAEDVANQRLQSRTEYLEWTLSFYQGTLTYQSGWEDIETYVLDAPSPQREEALLAQLRELGILIGGEWSKHNDLRLIDSRMLSLWGSIIQLAPDFDKQQETVELIASDVELLLSGNLEKEDILEARYSAILGLELFEDF